MTWRRTIIMPSLIHNKYTYYASNNNHLPLLAGTVYLTLLMYLTERLVFNNLQNHFLCPFLSFFVRKTILP